MKLFFENAEALKKGLAILAEDLGFKMTEDAPVTIAVKEADGDILEVALEGEKACITYGGGAARFFRGLAILVQWLKDGETKKQLREKPLFTTNGAMVDMSRNAVMNVKTVKFMLRKMALMGLNSFMLYTEDTYEIENRPYFGYMRGRYTKEEIQELDAYAIDLGIELIPCVQMLGHLATMLRWSTAAPYKDTERAMLVGAEATYQMIEDMLTSIEESFTSRRLHIGMDETHDLGTGKYLDLYGYKDRQDIYFEHLNRINVLIQNHGFKPMMWSDMFFRLAGKGLENFRDYDPRVELPANIGELVPQGVQQVFWDYYNPDEEFYAVNIEKHRSMGDNTLFAGGIWSWSSHCQHYSRSLRHTIPALEACRKAGIKEVIATIWHNGAEANLVMALAGLAWYADYDYKGYYCEESMKECFRYSCGQDYEDFMKTEQPEYPHGGEVGICRSVLYNDPLVGLLDKQIEPLDTVSYYKQVSESLKDIHLGKSEFLPAFVMIQKLSALLENKADYGVRLKKAYDRHDREALAALAQECDVIIEKLKELRSAHRKAWMQYNKPFGWEVMDIRYGGMLLRFDTAKARIQDYLEGVTEHIEELEAERLRYDGKEEGNGFGSDFLWYTYQKIATTGIL